MRTGCVMYLTKLRHNDDATLECIAGTQSVTHPARSGPKRGRESNCSLHLPHDFRPTPFVSCSGLVYIQGSIHAGFGPQGQRPSRALEFQL